MRGVSFTQADAVARSLGVALEHPRRIAAAAVHMLNEGADDGHCWTLWGAFVAVVAQLLALSPTIVEAHLEP